MPFKENRVRVSYYGELDRTSNLLVDVPTAIGHPQQKVHVLFAQAFERMSDACEKYLGFRLLVASGWRPHRWKSKEQYEQILIKKYTNKTKQELKKDIVTKEEILKCGRQYLAYHSAHTTGLAIDLGCGGLSPNSATIEQQKKTKLYKWLKENAWKYGIFPFLKETWHYEYNIPLEAYKTGKLDTTNLITSIEPVSPIIQTNDVCEDNICIEGPWDLDYLSKLDNT
jgi:hypothetical protein